MADAISTPDESSVSRPARVPVGKRLRFDVFKRDKFTCQYCGAKAPDVLLQCDHIQAVADGGGNDILNLITSCQPCNNGKGARPLSDSATLDKQRAMLADLEERRQQIDMMLAWRDEVQSKQSDLVQIVEDCIKEKTTRSLTPNGQANVRRWLKKFSVEEIIAAVDTAFDTYLTWDGPKPDTATWEHAFLKIPGCIGVMRQSVERPYLVRLLYVQGILRRRSRAPRLDRIDYLEHLLSCGATLDELEHKAKRCSDFLEFERIYDAWLDSIGMAF